MPAFSAACTKKSFDHLSPTLNSEPWVLSKACLSKGTICEEIEGRAEIFLRLKIFSTNKPCNFKMCCFLKVLEPGAFAKD
jgi:hypothetical protein